MVVVVFNQERQKQEKEEDKTEDSQQRRKEKGKKKEEEEGKERRKKKEGIRSQGRKRGTEIPSGEPKEAQGACGFERSSVDKRGKFFQLLTTTRKKAGGKDKPTFPRSVSESKMPP